MYIEMLRDIYIDSRTATIDAHCLTRDHENNFFPIIIDMFSSDRQRLIFLVSFYAIEETQLVEMFSVYLICNFYHKWYKSSVNISLCG